ncbi:hypothetical protein E0Z10_g10274 [Xylaria hypoxylon]|uniref:Uncharacterized protein n=1 Tax=Xylaria hypoxylon TaxID=37992 RepID=A0A4Z0Y3Z3_9PEZI|nr:hypothetical protein E0Z10_g10274 [Xylaria hypoxylon]
MNKRKSHGGKGLIVLGIVLVLGSAAMFVSGYTAITAEMLRLPGEFLPQLGGCHESEVAAYTKAGYGNAGRIKALPMRSHPQEGILNIIQRSRERRLRALTIVDVDYDDAGITCYPGQQNKAQVPKKGITKPLRANSQGTVAVCQTSCLDSRCPR